MVFYYSGSDDENDLVQFFKLRNIEYDPKTKTVATLNKCNWVTSHNKCKLYKFRPDICQKYECDKLKELTPLHYIL